MKDTDNRYRRPAPLVAILIPAAALLLFAWLSHEILESGTTWFDNAVRTAVHQWATPALTGAMRAVSLIGTGWLLTVLTIPLIPSLYSQHRRHAAILLGVTMIGATLLDTGLKLAFRRSRPVPFIGEAPGSYSFPSGHALASICFYSTVAIIVSAGAVRRAVRALVWTATAVLIAAIGLSRIYLGVHYPSDVIAGYLVGIFWMGALRLLSGRSGNPKK